MCRNGRRCVYSVWAFFGCLSGVPTRRVSPLSVHISAMSEDCSLQVRTGAGPPRRRRRPKRRCKGLSDMSMPMPKNVARRAGARIQIQREPTSCVRLIWRCFFGPQIEGWIARTPCLTPAHPSSRRWSCCLLGSVVKSAAGLSGRCLVRSSAGPFAIFE